MKVDLHIERLVLDGLPIDPADHPRLQEAVAAELTRLFAAGGVHRELRQGGAVPSVRAGAIEVGRAVDARGLGTRIARAVYGGIGK